MYETQKPKPCLAEFSFCIALDGAVTATGPLAVDKMHLVIKQTKTYIHDGLYDFIRDTNHLNRVENKPNKSTQSLNIDELCQRISPVIPKVSMDSIGIVIVHFIEMNNYFDFNFNRNSP